MLAVSTAQRTPTAPAPGAVRAARRAGLRWTRDDAPGIARRLNGGGFVYRFADGRAVRGGAIIRRIRALRVPPAWRDVWICPSANGHIQAVGRDARGRKQYRYHPSWRQVRDAAKFDRLLAFAERLPAVRAAVERDLARRGLPRRKVLATVVRLLERTLVRVGNEEYARANRSFGLTTLRDHHVQVGASRLRLSFMGKSGKRHEVTIADRRLAWVVRACQELAGQELFQYVERSGRRRGVGSADVNAYIRAAAGDDFSAKDFRTWAGTVLAAVALAKLGVAPTERAAKSRVVTAIKAVSTLLGNTPAVCRAGYVHPLVIERYLAGRTLADVRPKGPAALGADECRTVALLGGGR